MLLDSEALVLATLKTWTQLKAEGLDPPPLVELMRTVREMEAELLKPLPQLTLDEV